LIRSITKPGEKWELDERGISNYSFNFKYGPKFTSIFTNLFPETFEFSQETMPKISYGHPGLRTIVDFLTAKALSSIKTERINDCGSKYHKLSNMLRNLN
jgi:hypothetical protein